jgi:hypothetical protein
MDNLVLAINPSLSFKDRIVTAGLSNVAQLKLPLEGWLVCSGTVAGLLRNGWPVCAGTGGRFGPEYAVETPDGNLSKGMRQLNGVYTQVFNRRHHRVGHLFQGRFKGILVQKESHFLEVCRNPDLFAIERLLQ